MWSVRPVTKSPFGFLILRGTGQDGPDIPRQLQGLFVYANDVVGDVYLGLSSRIPFFDFCQAQILEEIDDSLA